MTGPGKRKRPVAIAADHGGVALKAELARYLQGAGYPVLDLGTDSPDPVDYPDYGFAAAEAVRRGEADRAILICKSGIGMAIAANKVQGVRAAPVGSVTEAEVSRRHNDANVLVLSAYGVSPAEGRRIVEIFLATPFDGGRHSRRLDKIRNFERAHWKD